MASSSVGVSSMAHTNEHQPDRVPNQRPESDQSWPDVKTFTESDLTDPVLIGKGGYGVVFRRQWKKDDGWIDIAEKQILHNASLDREAEVGLKREAKILQRIQHRNIISMYGILFGSQQFSLIMEYASHGNCFKFFKKMKEKKIEEEYKWPLKYQIAEQVCDAMKYLHCDARMDPAENNVLHLDLKSSNVLIDQKLDVKLCDFGLSRCKFLNSLSNISAEILSRGHDVVRGTITHIAPERLGNVNCDPNTRTDVYSYGIFIWELLSESEPYQQASKDLLRQGVLGGQRPDRKLIPKTAPELLKDIMVKSWDGENEERPEFTKIFEFLRRDPPYTRNDTQQSVSYIINQIDQVHSDSTIVMSPPRQEPFPLTTRSEGESRATPLPMYHRVLDPLDSQETVPKKPFPVQTCGSHGVRPEDFPTQTFTGLQQEETTPHLSSDLPTTSDIRASESVQDDEPLIEASSSQGSQTGRKKRVCFILSGLLVILVVAAAVALSLCWKNGCFGAPCKLLSPGDHQTMTCNPSISAGSAPHSGATCSFSCDQGYGIKIGLRSLTCEKNGSWSGSVPACSKLKSCPELEKPAHGGDYSCTDQFYEMSVCYFTCPPGYCIRTPGNTSCSYSSVDAGVGTTCNLATSPSASPEWSAPVPYCQKVATCPDLPSPTAGQYQCSDGGTPHTNGTFCRLQCNPHFGASIPSAITCCDNGTWNATKFPECLMECPALDTDFNGTYSCTQHFFVTSVCTYTCRTNFVLLGPLRVACLSNGSWKQKPPTCVCPSCLGGKNCDQPMTWNDTVAAMHKTYQTEGTFHYGDATISCHARHFSSASNSNYSCVCRDIPSNRMKQCNNYPTLEDACDATLSTFMRYMTYMGYYRLPCDANTMVPPCDTT